MQHLSARAAFTILLALAGPGCVAVFDTDIPSRPVDADSGGLDGGDDAEGPGPDTQSDADGGPSGNDGDARDDADSAADFDTADPFDAEAGPSDVDTCTPNACGGCAALDREPGTPCGACNRDRVICDGADSTLCDGDTACDNPVPTGVTASDATFEARVRISWTAVDGATAYRVYRNGTQLAEVTAPTVVYDDSTAAAGPLPAAPTVTASVDRTDGIAVSWVPPITQAGAVATYAVSAVVDGLESDLSTSDTGSRGARSVTGYELSVDDSPFVALSEDEVSTRLVLLEDPATAPLGGIRVGTVSATDGAVLVTLQASGFEAIRAEPTSIRMRAVVNGGTGAISAPTEGERRVGSLVYLWETATAESGPWSPVASAGNAATATDAAAPSDGSAVWYRVTVSATGAVSVTSAADTGYLGLAPAVPGSLTLNARPDVISLSWAAAEAAASYEVQTDGGAWLNVGNVLTWDDTGAPTPSIMPCTTIAVSSGTRADGVLLECVTGGSVDAALRSYRVRARNAIGVSDATDAVSGRRATPDISYTWERSAGDAATGFSTAVTSSTRTVLDTTAPAGAFRYWRVRLALSPSNPDLPAIPVSPSQRGYRAGVAVVSDPVLVGGAANPTSATFTLTVSAANAAAVSGAGLCLGLASSPALTALDAPSADGSACAPGAMVVSADDLSAAGSVTLGVAGLAPDEAWKIVGYASNVAGTAYSGVVTFSTPSRRGDGEPCGFDDDCTSGQCVGIPTATTGICGSL